MGRILKKTALLLLPVALYFCLFAAFEPNNYFGLRKSGGSEAPIARLKSFEQQPGSRIIIGDSRLAHFDMDLARQASGKQWQNLAFGGASLKESIDLAEYALDHNPELEEILFGLSFYTLNASYSTDRMSALEKTLDNPLAYVFNLEYNVNMLTNLTNWAAWLHQKAAGSTSLTWAQAQQEHETGDWQHPADYTGPDGTLYPVHTILARYPAIITPKCQGWEVSAQLERLPDLARRCASQGVALTVVLPPMADNVLDEVCLPLGIAKAMQQDVLPQLDAWSRELGFAVLDYEWRDRPDFDDDKQFFDGFHLDERYGLPQWSQQLFSALA